MTAAVLSVLDSERDCVSVLCAPGSVLLKLLHPVRLRGEQTALEAKDGLGEGGQEAVFGWPKRDTH